MSEKKKILSTEIEDTIKELVVLGHCNSENVSWTEMKSISGLFNCLLERIVDFDKLLFLGQVASKPKNGLNNPKLGLLFFEKASQKAVGYNYLLLARNVAEYLGPTHTAWLRDTIDKAIANIKDANDQLEVAKTLVELRVEGWKDEASHHYYNALKRINLADKLWRTGDEIAHIDGLNNHDLATTYFRKSLALAKPASQRIQIANWIANKYGLNNKEWAKEILDEVFETADYRTFMNIASAALSPSRLHDEYYALRAYEKAYELSTIVDDYLEIFNNIKGLNSEISIQLAKKTLKQAINSCKTPRDSSLVMGYISELSKMQDY